MQLIATADEIEKLVTGHFLRPNENNNEYVLTLIALSGNTLEVVVTTICPEAIKVNQEAAKEVDINYKGHEDIEDWIMSWRALWKDTRRSGMGNRERCITNMQEFFQVFPMYTKDHVFQARDKYFSTFNGDWTLLEQADYFIKKRVPDGEGKTEIRRTLLTYCEEVALDEEFGIKENFSAYDDV